MLRDVKFVLSKDSTSSQTSYSTEPVDIYKISNTIILEQNYFLVFW